MNYYATLWRRKTAGGGGGGGASMATLHALAYQIDRVANNATCRLNFKLDGIVNGDGQPDYNWLVTGVASDFELYVAHAGASVPSGTLNQWLNLSTTRQYAITRTSPGSNLSNITAQIRRVSDHVVVATANISLEAIAEGLG